MTMNKILIIANHFPPLALGGVQRPLKFAKYLPEYGWDPVVLTITPKKLIVADEFLLKEALDSGIKIERTGKGLTNTSNIVTRVQRQTFRKMKYYYSSLVHIPDSSIGWKTKAVKKAIELWDTYGGFNIIFATAPPYSNLLVAQELKKKFKVPLVIDYREGWVDSPLNTYPTAYHKMQNERLEKAVLRDADKVITNNRRMKELLISHYSQNSYNDIKIYPNGYDKRDIDFAASKNLPYLTKMRFTYSGSLNSKGLKLYFKSIKSLLTHHPEINDEIEFCYIGLTPKSLVRTAKELGIMDNLNLTGFLNHHEFVKYLLASDVLFLHMKRGENDDAIVPGVLGNYIGSRKNILGCIPDGESEKLLKEYRASKIVTDFNPDTISEAMFDYYQLFNKKKLPEANPAIVEKYEYKQYIEELSKELNYLMDLE